MVQKNIVTINIFIKINVPMLWLLHTSFEKGYFYTNSWLTRVPVWGLGSFIRYISIIILYKIFYVLTCLFCYIFWLICDILQLLRLWFEIIVKIIYFLLLYVIYKCLIENFWASFHLNLSSSQISPFICKNFKFFLDQQY